MFASGDDCMRSRSRRAGGTVCCMLGKGGVWSLMSDANTLAWTTCLFRILVSFDKMFECIGDRGSFRRDPPMVRKSMYLRTTDTDRNDLNWSYFLLVLQYGSQ